MIRSTIFITDFEANAQLMVQLKKGEVKPYRNVNRIHNKEARMQY